jgi:co-chaperonin GroES (HSP10)
VGPDVEVNNEDGVVVGPQVGDLVIFAKYAGTTFKTRDGKELLILKVDDILGVIES